MEQPFLIVGLGNPGPTYEQTRHNTGFLALERIKQQYELPPFSHEKYSNSLMAKGMIHHTSVILAKPQTFMNNSGLAVASLCKSTGIPLERLIVIHDEVDLPLGSIRIGRGHGSAGHRGVESLIAHLGAKEFTRVRVGVQKDQEKPQDTESFVLSKFSNQEQDLLEKVLDVVAQGIPILLEQSPERASDFCAKKLGET